MGLDNFWVDSEGKQASVTGDFKVCGGIFSGHGDSSFRGKVYANVVQEITGVSLYQDKIDNSTVRSMALKLQSENVDFALGFGFSAEEWNDFVLMFKKHAEAGHQLISWW